MDHSTRIKEETIDRDAVCALTDGMLESAKEEEWEDLASQEARRVALINKVFGPGAKESVGQEGVRRKREMIQKILSTDQQTRELILKKMSGIRMLFNREKQIVEAYGPHI